MGRTTAHPSRQPSSPAAPVDGAKKARLRAALLGWFQRHQRDLPWRRTRDPYAIWLSEVMLQQTQVATVIPYWERFLQRFPDVRALAAAPLPDVLAGWRGLGYYSRARNLHRAAAEVVARHGGALPPTAAGLQALPGFGRYTAGAVASIAFGEAAPVVDGNVARVFARVFAIEGAPSDPAREKALWAVAKRLVDGPRPGQWNQALMELGALVCRPEQPACLLCPVRECCEAARQGRQGELPAKRVRAPRKVLSLAVGVFVEEGRVLLGRRHDGGLFGGLWELPTAELASDEPAAARAALCGVLGKVELSGPLGLVRRTLTHRELSLHLWKARGKPSAKRAQRTYQELAWVSADEARTLGMSTAMSRALSTALEALEAAGRR